MAPRAVFALVVTLLVAWAPFSEGASKWARIRTQHFVVEGDVGERELRNVAVRLEQFRAAMEQLFSLKSRPATTFSSAVVVFPPPGLTIHSSRAIRASPLLASKLADVEFISYREGLTGTVNCRKPDGWDAVYVTWRPAPRSDRARTARWSQSRSSRRRLRLRTLNLEP